MRPAGFCCLRGFARQPRAAQLAIEITGAGAQRIPIAIAPFAGESALPRAAFAPSCARDLERSGLFRSARGAVAAAGAHRGVAASTTPSGARASPTRWWSARWSALPDGRFEARFARRRRGEAGAARRASRYTTGAASSVRATGAPHRRLRLREADRREGRVLDAASPTSSKRGNAYELQIADADGAGRPDGAQASFEPIISPAWSPDGKRLAYVSFENKKPVVYVHSLADGEAHASRRTSGLELRARPGRPDGSAPRGDAVARGRLADLPVMAPNGSGAAAPHHLGGDRHRAALLPRRPGGSISHPTGAAARRSTAWPRPAASRNAITFEGSYNVTPRLSPDGKTLAYITRNGGKFQVALLDLANRQVQIITDSDRDESPSFAPNGRMILLATVIGGRGVLSAVSADGRVKQRLTYAGGRRARAGLGAVHRLARGGNTMRTRILPIIAAASLVALFAACSTTPERATSRRRAPSAAPAPTPRRRRGRKPAPTGRPDRAPASARCSRTRATSSRSARSSSTTTSSTIKDEYKRPGRGARQVPAREPGREDAHPGQCRRARQPRVQRRPRPAPLRHA